MLAKHPRAAGQVALILGLVLPGYAAAAEPCLTPPLARPTGKITAATVVTNEQYQWLAEKTRQITAAVRLKMKDGTVVYAPGGKYVGFWPRDCYYVVHGAPQLVPAEEIRGIVRFLVERQRSDGMMPVFCGSGGSATYGSWDPSPADGDAAQFVVLMMAEYFQRSSDRAFVKANLPRLKRAMDSMPRDRLGLIWINPKSPHCSYGFTDQVKKTGSELFCSLLYWEASRELAKMAKAVDDHALAADYLARAALIEKNLDSLWDEKSGMYLAASEDCRQIDIWGSAYMVYIRFPEPAKRQRICRYLVNHYPEIVYAGQVRHLPGGEAWQKLIHPHWAGTSQNGGYWGTASGWVAYAIAQVDPPLASKMLGDMIDYYRRVGAYEWVCDYALWRPDYAASVSNPLDAIHRLRGEGQIEAQK